MAASFQNFLSVKLRQSGVEIERIDPLAGDTWDQEVTARDDHTIFHRSAWARVEASQSEPADPELRRQPERVSQRELCEMDV